MTFVDLALKETYDSDEDDILNDFYVPVLSRAVRYDRLAGYFSSAALATAARGMARFIQNGGVMRLVTSMQISAEDQDAIKRGHANPEEVIAKMMQRELELADRMQRDHVEALAWMVANKSLEIKIAIPLDAGVGYYTGDISVNSIFHQKIGILHDDSGNVISFSGSVNETGKAWHDNIEEFKVFCSWLPGQDTYGSSDSKKFEKFWYGQARNTAVMDLPTAIRDRLIQIAPKTMLEAIGKLTGTGRSQILRDYQTNAVQEWTGHDMRGIFEMATGTGKTHAAISCVKRALDDPNAGCSLVVISCPFIHLVTQWADQLKAWGIKADTAYGSSESWSRELGNKMLYLNDGVLNHAIIVTTHTTLSGQKFTDMIKSCKVKSMIVADEVHRLGAEKNRNGLLESYDYRLGLSATPERYFDDEGTKKILGFFGGVIFRFELSQAIESGYLTRYHLFPHIVYMTGDEADEYNKISRAIAIEASKENPNYDRITNLSIKRSNVVKSASNKLAVFSELIRVEELDHCLVYCTGQQLRDAADILHGAGLTFHRFTLNESKDDRKKLLDEFDRGEKDVLLAIKCLDEGVDVPSARTAIILASSHNPIEFVQRRGRLLRPYDGKDHAIIRDLIVLPPLPPKGEIHTEAEAKIIREEFARLEEFAGSSDNPEHSRQVIKTFMNKHSLEQ